MYIVFGLGPAEKPRKLPFTDFDSFYEWLVKEENPNLGYESVIGEERDVYTYFSKDGDIWEDDRAHSLVLPLPEDDRGLFVVATVIKRMCLNHEDEFFEEPVHYLAKLIIDKSVGYKED